VRDAATGTVTEADLSTSGAQPNAAATGGWLSDDGGYVTFESAAPTWLPASPPGVTQVDRRDLQTGTTILVSVGSSGLPGNKTSERPRISGDGRYLVYESLATNLVTAPASAFRQIYLRDTLAGTTRLVSAAAPGGPGDGVCPPLGVYPQLCGSFQPQISQDGSYVLYASNARTIVPNTTGAFPQAIVTRVN